MSSARQIFEIRDLSETFLKCVMCVEHFNQTDRGPRLLHFCLHAICAQCLDKLLKEGSHQIPCPLCQQVHNVTEIVSVDLVRDKLVEYEQIKKHRKVICSECSDRNESESKCEECRLYLCNICTYVHKQHRFTKDHTIIPLNNVLEQPLHSFSRSHYCPHHVKHQLEFYCVTDESICCAYCRVLDHQDHDVKRAEEVIQTIRQGLESRLGLVTAHIAKLENRRQTEDDLKVSIQEEQIHSRTEIIKEFANIEKIVKDRQNAVLNDTELKGLKLLSLCDVTLTTMNKSLDSMQSTENYLTLAQDATDAVEKLQMIPSWKRYFGEPTLESIPEERNPEGFHVKFEPLLVSSLKKILPETGYVADTTGTAAPGYTDATERQTFLNEVITMALSSKNKKELLAKLTEDIQERAICSRCRFETDKPMKIKCRHLLCPICFDAVIQRTEVCHDCTITCNVQAENNARGDMTPTSIKSMPRGDMTPTSMECMPQVDMTPAIIGSMPRGDMTPTSTGSMPRRDMRPTNIESMPQGYMTPTSIESIPWGDIPPASIGSMQRRDMTPTSIGSMPRGDMAPTGIESMPRGDMTPSITGNMPPGDMTTTVMNGSLCGYEGVKTIKIRYFIDGACELVNHPSPAKGFRGIDTTAYLPDNQEGQTVLALLKVAWEKRLTYRMNLNDHGYYLSLRIPHKINIDGGRERNGYPDPCYLEVVKKKLAELGVTEDDI